MRERERPPHSLSPGGRDAAGSVTNGEREREATALPFPRRTRCDRISGQRRERERPPQPCVRYSEERQTRQAGSIVYSERTTFFSIKIVLYFVYVPLSNITLFKNNAATRQVKLCFVHAWYTTSLGKQPLQAFKLARGLPFRKEMSSTVYPRGCGWARSVSTCTVHLFSSCIRTPPAWGCVRDTNLERYSVWVLESFFWGVNQKMEHMQCV